MIFGLLFACAGGDTDTGRDWACVLPADPVPDYSHEVGCREDFDLLAADPLDASISGAQSSKTVIDRVDGNRLYFTNSELYPIHFDFASKFASGDGLPFVTDLSTFNSVEYYSPDRRFILGAVTWYEDAQKFVYEIAPYDTADADMIAQAYHQIADGAYFGGELYFHPTSEAVERVAATLPAEIKQITTEQLYAGMTYQPLNLGSTMGQLRFYHAADAENYVNYREIVVLDEIPNDISVVAATVTGEFQTPLAHINVLAQNRGTPNMALSGAFENDTLRALEGRWVELTVEPNQWAVREVTEAEADAWWEAHKPESLEIRPMDLDTQGLWECMDILDLSLPLGDALDARLPAFGGKVTNMAAMVHIGEDVPTPDCYAIPLYYYNQHMERNGLWERYQALTEDPDWGDARARAAMLEKFQQDVVNAPIDPDFIAMVVAKATSKYGQVKMRFRSSTNAEDLGSFTGAGLYTSKSGEYDDWGAGFATAIKTVWASTWGPRAWEEREYWGIDHTRVGMAILSYPTIDDEEANGVAITGNIYDTSGLEPAFYINVQRGEDSVVIPEDGDTTDQIIYYYTMPNQPIVYIAHSNLVAPGETVLTDLEIYELGTALSAVHNYFYPAYGTDGGWYAMETEFKFQDGELLMKQGRPYPGWKK